MCFREPVCQDESELPESAVPDCWGALWMQETPGLPACSAEIGEERHHVRLFRRSLAESREQLSFFLQTEEAFQLLPLRTALSADARMRASVR